MQSLMTGKTGGLSMRVSRYRTVLSFVFFAALLVAMGQSFADERTQAKRIHDRLTGVVPTAAVLDQMEQFIKDNDDLAAANLAMDNKNFYNATLVNFATPWTNEAQAIFPEDMDTQGILNDYTATVIGVIRDEVDFRKILYADILYKGKDSLGLTNPYRINDNAHYKELEERVGLNLKDDLVLEASAVQSTITGFPPTATSGVLTSRAAAKAFFSDGTNRAMFRFTVLNHLCQDMEQLKDNTLPSDRIRQDVSRSPGGDSRLYMNQCIGCHTGMDPMTQAFAYYDYTYPITNGVPKYEEGQMVYSGGSNTVQAKNLINADNFKPGFIVPNDSWKNYWRQGKNTFIKWDTALDGFGTGASSMAQELAHSQQFAQCQVEKVFKAVCLRPAGDDADRAAVTSIVSKFTSQGYNLKQVFAETAVYCKGP